jgi:HSP20 family protein
LTPGRVLKAKRLTKLSIFTDHRLCFCLVHCLFLSGKQSIKILKKKEVFMATQTLAKINNDMPSLFDDFFKPWNEWFDSGNTWGRTLKVPAVNIVEQKDKYEVSLAAPGLKKDDFKIDVDGNMLTISSKKEEQKEEKDERCTRKEYSYSSFSRSFNLPEEINQEKIAAKYEDGVLKISLPRREESNKISAKHINVN